MKQSVNDLDKAKKKLGEFYYHALKQDYIYNPIAWALYQTWKYADEKEYKKERS